MKNTSGKLINDLHLSVLYHIINIKMKQLVGLERLGEVVDIFKIFLIHNRPLDKVALLQNFFDAGKALIGKGNVFIFLVDFIVANYFLALGFIGVFTVFFFLNFLKAA